MDLTTLITYCLITYALIDYCLKTYGFYITYNYTYIHIYVYIYIHIYVLKPRPSPSDRWTLRHTGTPAPFFSKELKTFFFSSRPGWGWFAAAGRESSYWKAPKFLAPERKLALEALFSTPHNPGSHDLPPSPSLSENGARAVDYGCIDDGILGCDAGFGGCGRRNQ